MNNQIVKGSLSEVAQTSGKSLAEVWLDVDAMILVDVSWSMVGKDNTELSRLDRARKELIRLQGEMSGKLAIVSFSESVEFHANGILPDEQSTTNLTGALKYALRSDAIPGFRFVIISDGEPDNSESALKVAKSFKNKIDTVFIGGDFDGGRKFLEKLSGVSGGKSMSEKAEHLESAVVALLEG